MTRKLRIILGASWGLLSVQTASAQIKAPALDTLASVDSMIVRYMSAAYCASPAKEGRASGTPLIIINDSIVRPGSFALAACKNTSETPAQLRRMEFVRPRVAEKMYGPAARAGALSLWIRRGSDTRR